MLRRDGKHVMKVLQEGLATVEHAALITQLESRRGQMK